jgi:predicted N-acetyltransferase YhbS
MRLEPLSTAPPARVEALLDSAFGTDRHGKTAYRVRAGLTPIASLSFAAWDEGDMLAGVIQCWPVALARDSGAPIPMVMVGPVAVDPSLQRSGLGRQLMERALEAAAESPLPGSEALMLVGDPEYYARFFAFSAERTAKWRLPGPFEPRRLLARGAVPDEAGEIVGRP